MYFQWFLYAIAGIALARISYSNSVCLSVLVSVTSWYCSKTRWDGDFKFSPYDSLEFLVFRDRISGRWVKIVPTNEGQKSGTPLKDVILPLLACLTWKWLQIGTDILLIITSTVDELFRNVNIDDLEWPWTLKILVFSDFLAIFFCKTVNCGEMSGDRPRLSANWNCYRLSCIS